MKMLGLAVLAGVVLAAAPSEARGFYPGPHFGIGFGFGYPGCWGCAPYYPPYPPYYGPYYGPPPYPPPPPPPYYGQAHPLRDEQRDNSWRVTRQQGETDYELPDNVLFALDSAKISPNATSVLDEVAQAAREQRGAKLIVEGHTDTSGSREHNQQLSDARARAVADALEHNGVARGRIRSEGLGERGLAVQTGDNVREAKNRRVVIRLMDAPGAARVRDDRDGGRN